MSSDPTARLVIGRMFDTYDEASEFWSFHNRSIDHDDLTVDIVQYADDSEYVILGIQLAYACYIEEITFDLPARIEEAKDILTFIFGISFKKDLYLVAYYG